jgi:signal peptidase I
MDWSGLANLNIETVLSVSFFLALIRLTFFGIRKQLGYKSERFWGELCESLLFAWVVVFLIIRPFWFEPFKIPSASMHNTLLEGDRILVTKYQYRFHPPQRGDIIVFKSPPEAHNNEVDFVKRLIGLPGDRVEIRDGTVYINGSALNEPYLHEPMNDPPYFWESPVLPHPYRVPQGHYLMMGDNRNQSLDGRYWGYLDGTRIKGKAVAIFWPPSRVTWFKAPPYALKRPAATATAP